MNIFAYVFIPLFKFLEVKLLCERNYAGIW